MNLYEVIHAIEAEAAAQPPVGCIVRNDVYRLNSHPAVKYGVFAWLQGEHRDASTSEGADIMEWNFTLFYVDRLTENKDNEIQAQSTGIEVLQNILAGLEARGLFAGEHSFRTFNERFADECAGVFCVVTLSSAKGDTCAEDWDYEQDIQII